MNIFHISFSDKIVVQTAWYGIDRPVHFSKSHWYSLFLSFPFCSDIFSPPVLCQSSNYSYTPMNIIMYKAQALDLMKFKLCMQYAPKRYISGEHWSWRWWWQIPMKCWCPAPNLHSVTVPKTTSCVLSILWTSKCTAYLYVFNQTVSDCLAFTSYRNFSLFHSKRQKEGEQKIHVRFSWVVVHLKRK